MYIGPALIFVAPKINEVCKKCDNHSCQSNYHMAHYDHQYCYFCGKELTEKQSSHKINVLSTEDLQSATSNLLLVKYFTSQNHYFDKDFDSYHEIALYPNCQLIVDEKNYDQFVSFDSPVGYYTPFEIIDLNDQRLSIEKFKIYFEKEIKLAINEINEKIKNLNDFTLKIDYKIIAFY